MELPNDLVMEILSRLPLAKLGKAKALSKYHAQASHESFYKELAAKHGPIFLDGFVLQDLEHDGYRFYFASPYPNFFNFSLDFIPGKNPRIRATAANGLVLVETSNPCSDRNPIYSICKPSTKQCKGLPLPRIRYSTKNMALFVLRSNPLHFKILRLSSDKPSSKRSYSFSYTICELFDSQTWRWKRLNDDVRDPSFGNLESYLAPVLASGCAHWKISDTKSIFAFDFYSETWSTIPMPKAIIEEYEDTEKTDVVIPRWHTELVAYKGKLGLIRKFFHESKTDSTELWVMDNYFNRTWTKRNGLLECMAPMAFYGSDVSVSLTFDEMTFSNLETKNCSSLKLRETNFRSESKMDTFSFMTDFEPWDFHHPPRTLNPRTLAKIIKKQSQPIINYSK